MSVATNIQQARKAAKLTQAQLADKIGKGFSTVQKYELGLANPPIEVLQKIATVLNVAVADLLTPQTERGYGVLGPRMAAARKRKKITQKDLAEKLGLATGTIQQYELGKRRPDIDVLKAIASALDVSVDALVSTNEPEDEYELICDTLATAGLHITDSGFCPTGDADRDIYYISRAEDPDDPDSRKEIEYARLAELIHSVLADAEKKKIEYLQKRLEAELL